MSNNSWQPAISSSWIGFIFSWCCSDAAFIQHVLGKLTSQSSLQVLVVPVGVSGLKSSSSWRSEKSHCSSGKVSKTEIKPKAWRNSREARGLKRPRKKSYWNPEGMLNEWAGSPGRETAQGEGTERACRNDFVTVQESLVREPATEVLSISSAASCGPRAIVRGDSREDTGKRGRWVLRWILGRVSFPTDEHLAEELLHMKAEHALVPLKRLSGKCATQLHSTKHLHSSQNICGPPLWVPTQKRVPIWRLTTAMGIYDFSSVRFEPFSLHLLAWHIYPASASHLTTHISHWAHDRNNKRTNIHRVNPPTRW